MTPAAKPETLLSELARLDAPSPLPLETDLLCARLGDIASCAKRKEIPFGPEEIEEIAKQLREMAAEIADLKGHADGWMEVAREAEDRLAERDELKEDGKRIEGLLRRWLFMNSIAPRMDTEEMQIIANAAMAVLKQETRIRLDLPVPKEKAARAASEGNEGKGADGG